jgi:hypothetical protein
MPDMHESIHPWGVRSLFIYRLLFRPMAAFQELSADRRTAASIFFRYAVWLGMLPPLFAYIGASLYGWRVGAVEPLFLPADKLLGISIAYYITLLFGFISTALVSQWMAATYDASSVLGTHFGLVTIVGAPLIAGSIMHLYPHAFLNVLVLVPVLIWSMYLLFRGLPVALRTTPERGMLMASSLIAYLLVAMVSLLGITMVLWTWGLGPALGI